jgi:hypothetical protein
LKFWNSRPPDLICSLLTTISFLTSKNTSREKVFEHWGGHINCGWVVCSTTRKIFLGLVKEFRTTKS